MIPLSEPNLSGKEKIFLDDCILSGFVSSIGPYVDRFEKHVADIAGGLYSVATSSGTSGLYVSLKALGVERGDIVILPSYSFIGSANAISLLGALPWFMDIDKNTMCLDINLLYSQLKKECRFVNGKLIHKKSNSKISAIMPVHALGIPIDIDSIINVSKSFNLPVVFDAAGAIGSTYKNKKIAENTNSISVFSFNGNKTITSGGGGAVVSNDLSLIKKIRKIVGTGRINNSYDHDTIGFNLTMTNIEAAVGCAQIESLDKFINAKKNILSEYNNSLKKIKGISFLPKIKWGESSCWMSGIFLDLKVYSDIAKISSFLKERNIDARPFWKPINKQLPYKNALSTDCPVSEDTAKRFLALPCATNLNKNSQNFVISSLIDVLSKKNF